MIEDAMWFLDGSTNSSEAARIVLRDVSKIALIIAAACFIITVLFDWLDNALKAYKSGAERQPLIQLDKLVKGAIIIGLIAIYPLLSGGYMTVVREINKMTQIKSEELHSFTARINTLNQAADLTTEEEKLKEIFESDKKFNVAYNDILYSAGQDAADSLKNQRLIYLDLPEEEKAKGWARIRETFNPANYGTLIIGGVVKGLIVMVRFVIKGIAIYLFQILLVFGSLAMAFSLLKSFENTFEIWFKTTLTTGLALTTMNVLDHLSNSMLSVMLSGKTGMIDGSVALDIEVILLVCYVSTFWITGKFVAKTDAGGFLTKIVAVSTVAVKAAVGGASGGGK